MRRNLQKRIALQSGDLNAFFGLFVDNMTQLVIMAGILVGVFHYPREIVFNRMIPGSAVGVFVGDLVFTIMAVRLSRRSGRDDITAMPLGIDTPSLFAFIFGVVGPAFVVTKDADLAWKISMAVIVIVGMVKMIGALFGPAIRRAVPRAGLLGPIAGIALLLIAFLPSLKIFQAPLVGFLSLIIILTCIIGKVPFPFRLPAALAAALAGTLSFYLLAAFGFTAAPPVLEHLQAIHLSLPVPTLGFIEGLPYVLPYLPLAIPFALVVIIGGIDVTESAAAAGDEYDTRSILLTSGLSTLISGLCGGVTQTTPYIGHPAYKEMGGGVGYTFLTALFIGLGGVFGYLGLMVDLIPEAAVAPILVFIGLEITAQAFNAAPPKHTKAVALAFLPSIADLVLIQWNGLLGHLGKRPADLQGQAAATYQMIALFANGFVITSLLWGAGLALIIDRQLRSAAAFFCVGAGLAFFGMIHSPFPDGRIFFPWQVDTTLPYSLSVAYGLMAAFLLGMAWRQENSMKGSPA